MRDAGMLTMIDGPELISNSRRHDRNSGRRPVESSLYPFISQAAFGRMTSELALRLANTTMSASFRDVRHTSDVRQVAV